jgi:hypothetical protein
MKKISVMTSALSALSLAVVLGGCSDQKTASDAAAEKVQGVPAAETGSAPVKASAKPVVINQKNEALDFSFAYPAEAAAIAGLARQLDADGARQLDEAQKAANEDVKNSKENDYPLRQHVFAQKWQLVAQTPRFLSLSSDIETYTGGAHGMVNFATLLWDKEKAASLDPVDIFTSKAAYDSAVSKSFCDGIAAAKRAKGIEPNEAADGVFESCPKASEHTLWLGSSDGKLLDRLTIGITAYVVGPYVEGNYRIDVPMNSALKNAVKPEYAAFVGVKR